MRENLKNKMTIESKPIVELEGLTAREIESDHQRDIRETATMYLRSAALIDPKVRSAIDSAKNLPVKYSNGHRPSVESVREFHRAQNPDRLTHALRNIVGERELNQFIPTWTDNFDTIANGGMGDDYIQMISADPGIAGVFVDATSLVRAHLRNLSQEAGNPPKLHVTQVVADFR